MDARIESAVRDDVAGIVALLRDDELGATREEAAAERYLNAFDAVAGDPRHLLAVARGDSGELLGTMHLTLLPGLSRGATTRLQVEAVRVAAAARGTGLGARMMAWAHEWGRSHGATLAQLTSDHDRTDAHRFYERLGYAASHQGFKRAL